MYKAKYISFDITGLKESIASAQLVLFKSSSGVLGGKQTIRWYHAQGTNTAYPNFF